MTEDSRICHRMYCILILLLLWTTKTCKAEGEFNNTENKESNGTTEERKQFCDNEGVWHEDFQRCTCTLGWVGTRCNVWHNHRCYFDNGLNYRGQLRVTVGGQICKPWTTIDNSRFELGRKGIGIHNFCRNPDNDEKGLWCYVHGDDLIGYCNATRCPDSVRDLLSVNATEIGTEDESSAAVQFVFGPLISGVCAGVVALLGFIAIAEYLRRRRYWARKKKREMQNDVEKHEDKHGGNVKDDKDGTEELETSDTKEKKQQAQKLGGVITVNVDTGKKKYWDASAKGFSNAAAKLEPIDQGGEVFVSSDTAMQCFSSTFEGEIGPPPPYKLRISQDRESIIEGANENFDDNISTRDDMISEKNSDPVLKQVDEIHRSTTPSSKPRKRRKNKTRNRCSSPRIREPARAISCDEILSIPESQLHLHKNKMLADCSEMNSFEESVASITEKPTTARCSHEKPRSTKPRKIPQNDRVNAPDNSHHLTKTRHKKRRVNDRIVNNSSGAMQTIDDSQKSVRDLKKVFEKEQNSSLSNVSEEAELKRPRKKQREVVSIGVTVKNKKAEPTTFL